MNIFSLTLFPFFQPRYCQLFLVVFATVDRSKRQANIDQLLAAIQATNTQQNEPSDAIANSLASSLSNLRLPVANDLPLGCNFIQTSEDVSQRQTLQLQVLCAECIHVRTHV
jgi:hypothetical protein